MSQMMLRGCGSSGPGGGVSIIGFGSSLVGRWFTGNAVTDLSGNGRNATLQSTATYSTTIPTVGFAASHSLSLNGTSDYATVAHNAAFSIVQNFTVSLWIRLAAVNGFRTSFCKGTNAAFYNYKGVNWDGGKHSFETHNGTSNDFLSSTTLSTSTWYHLAFVYDGANKIIYLNGASDNSTAVTGDMPTNTGDLFFGRNGQDASQYHSGLLFDIRIYNATLTPTQIATIADGNG